MEFQYSNVLIWGYGISGHAVEKILIDQDVDYTILDEGEKINGGGFISKLTKRNIANFDLIVLSPGVKINRKEIQYARSIGIDVISEVEFGYMFLDPSTKVIAVTGTNGKTTTTDLIYTMLTNAGKSCVEVGNIGKPVSAIYGSKYDYAIVELSSFQLDGCKNFKADIAVFLNVAPDHLDWHKTFDNYLHAKLNIFNNQQRNDYAVINAEDAILANIKSINAKRVYFASGDAKAKYAKKGEYIVKNKNEIVNISTIPCVFEEDVLAMVAVGDIIGIDSNIMQNTVNTYSFLPHRCEFVTKINGKDFYNDSKATNIHATLTLLNKIDKSNILLLLGGRNKRLDFKTLINSLDQKVSKIVAFGECRNSIIRCKKYNKNITFYKVKNLHSFMENIEKYWEGVDTIILSPACASFDEFQSYVDRGEYYIKAVCELQAKYEKTTE